MHTLLICVASSFPVHFACSSFSFNPSLSVFSNHSSALTNNYQPLSGFLCLLLFSFHLIQFAYLSLFLSFVHINPLPPLLSPSAFVPLPYTVCPSSCHHSLPSGNLHHFSFCSFEEASLLAQEKTQSH